MNESNTCCELQAAELMSPFLAHRASEQSEALKHDPNLTDFLRELNRLRMIGALCDCILATTDKATFRVHKVVLAMCSDYFRTLFTTTLAGKDCGDSAISKTVYHVPNVSSESLESIITFAYSGIVHINEKNVNELLPAADQFNVKGIVSECIDFMLGNMTAENCIGIWRFGAEYFMAGLEKESRKYILVHFVQIVNTEEFLHLNYNLVKDILKDNALNVPTEFFVWTAIKRWWLHDYLMRRKYIPELCLCVRLALVTINELREIMDEPCVVRHAQCRTYINIVSKYVLDPSDDLSREVQDNEAVFLFRPRYPYEVILTSGGWGIDGPINILEVYDPRADIWKILDSKDFTPRSYHQTLCLRENLYILGGSTGPDYLNSCRRFDIKKFRFEEISPMKEQRAFLSSAVLNGKIYALGGFNGHVRLKTVEFYDEDRNQWTYISSMNENRSDASASSLRDRIFIVGGYNGIDFLQTAECYFAEFDQWFYLSLMVKCRSGVGCVAMDDSVYAIGGYDGEHRLNSVEKYCFFQSQWFASKPMKQRRSNFAIAVLEKKIYVMGGYDDVSDDTMDQVECFDPAQPEWHPVASLSVGRSGLSACVFSSFTRMTPYIKDDRVRCRLKNISIEENVTTDRGENSDTLPTSQVSHNVFV